MNHRIDYKFKALVLRLLLMIVTKLGCKDDLRCSGRNFDQFEDEVRGCIEDVFGPAVVGYSAPEPKHDEEDPFQSAEYARFVSSMVPHCHCRANNCPCDGVLAGGPCDMVQEEEPQERMEDEEDEQP